MLTGLPVWKTWFSAQPSTQDNCITFAMLGCFVYLNLESLNSQNVMTFTIS